MMIIDIDVNRYTKITRGRALKLLAKAELVPDRFIAHKDKTYTAKFKRERRSLFQSSGYEERFETASGHRVAILKRPNYTLDRGPYVTLRFAITELALLGLDVKPAPRSRKSSRAKLDVSKPDVTKWVTAARDVKHLAVEARQLAIDGRKHDQLLILLDEIKRQTDQLLARLEALS
jgi:hypothetical protein